MITRKQRRTNERTEFQQEEKKYALLLSFVVEFFFSSACFALLLVKCVLMYSIQSTNRSCMQYGIITYPPFVRTLHTYTLKSLNYWRYIIVVRRAKEQKKNSTKRLYTFLVERNREKRRKAERLSAHVRHCVCVCVNVSISFSLSPADGDRETSHSSHICTHIEFDRIWVPVLYRLFSFSLSCFVIRLSEFVGHRRRRRCSCHLRSLNSSNLNGKYTLWTHVEYM